MKRLMLCTALVLMSATGMLRAQSRDVHTKTDLTFNPCEKCYIRIKDIVLMKDERMTLELFRIEDYDLFKNMDSILMSLYKDVAFYKDSLEGNGTDNVRIDYVYNLKNNTRKIRFRKYAANGQSFVRQNNDVSKLKIEQDTIHIVLENTMPLEQATYIKIKGSMGKQLLSTFPYSVQATFVLNNYTDIDRLIANKAEIRRIIDTLKEAKKPLQNKKGYIRAVSSVYRPYLSGYTKEHWRPAIVKYRQFTGIIKDESDYGGATDYLTVDMNVGVGLLRNTLAPTADLGLQIVRNRRKYDPKTSNTYGLYFQPIFLFEKNSSGNYITNTNGFVNVRFGEQTNEEGCKRPITRAFGAGYLILNKGDYFKKNTFKVFMDLQLNKDIRISPELIITDNGKQVFPGLTLKVF